MLNPMNDWAKKCTSRLIVLLPSSLREFKVYRKEKCEADSFTKSKVVVKPMQR